MGVREVTNADFLDFLRTPEGEPWRVEEITVAGSGPEGPQSPYQASANEYYLYFWENGGHTEKPRYRPRVGALRDPVV